MSPSAVNSFRIAAVTERLALHVLTPPKNDAVEFFNLCLSLARGIDYAVANGEVPDRIHDLPMLLKQVCQCRNDTLLQAAIMVLMISVKNACKSGWFPTKDSEELLTLADEIGSSFCTLRDLNTEARNSLQTISTIMSRFYPRMKLGKILAFLEAKPGYGAFVIDFHISKNEKPSAEDKIRLFVAQVDNIETSSCIISPQQVNFLLNGKGVERRTNVFMDTGPQLPTAVTHMLKFGTNLLQAVGQFCGNYVIVVAYMSMTSNPDRPVLPDYVQPAAAAAVDSDTEIIEGPSRISLNCPISFRRIKTPVKGHSCKHRQCFDFDNFVDINSRRPSWRCPTCNQCICYIDICIDQNMVKTLREVGENVVDVIISADGSWKAVLETNDNADQPHETNGQQDGPVQDNAGSISNIPPDFMDLTEGDDEMDVVHIFETQDRKPILDNAQSQYGMNNPSELNQNDAPIEDDFWSGIFLSTYGSGPPSARSDSQLLDGVSGSAPTNSLLSPVLTDAVSPALNREPEAFRDSALFAASISQSQLSAPSNLPLQQSQFGNSIASNEYGRVPSMTRHNINRTPIAVQALPAQTLTSVPQQRPRNGFSTFTLQGPSLASQTSAGPSVADGFNTASTPIERQQQYSRAHLSTLQMPQTTSSSLPQHAPPSNWNHQDLSFLASQAAQHIVGLPAQSQLPSAYRPSSAPITEHQHLRQQHSMNVRIPHGMSQPPSMMRLPGQPSTHFQRNHIPQGSAQTGVAQTAVPGSSQRLMLSAQRASQMARQPPSVPVCLQATRASPPPSSSSFPINTSGFRASVRDQRGNTGGTLQLQSAMGGTDGLEDLPGEQNWRPTGRMRGSLSGRAYSDALNQFIIQPTQPAQAARPPLNITSPPPGIPAPLHVLMPNRNAAQGPHVANYPSTKSTGMTGGSGVLPEPASGGH
ncbi:E4 SUMO-protein like [Actinidia chinensis var. chinensis]|uniref:E4 SUMO-protein like n=1 Tax=Actinidia chinensis var. chinensis TaxID=1590841 RepID=A0A2R6QN63_ACTCC|nr:E4 SUMO-protein like [Actinidia chinensis var. chinensis]